MSLVEVRDLARTFVVRPRRRGLRGAFTDLLGTARTVVPALDGVSFDLEPGEVVAYLGPNGAGKSTTVKCLTGILAPTAGTVRVAGLDPWRQRRDHVRHIGVVFGQRTQLWWDLAVQEAFDLLAAVFRVEAPVYRRRLAELDALLDLGPLLRTPVRQLSLGQRVRCDLAAALLHGPRLLLLDEPTIGLDVAVRQKVRRFLRALAAEQEVAILLTTHDLRDVEALCHRALLLDRGRLRFDGSLAALRAELGDDRVLHVETGHPLGNLEGLEEARAVSETAFEVRLPRGEDVGPVVQRVLDRVEVEDLHVREPDLETLVAGIYREEG